MGQQLLSVLEENVGKELIVFDTETTGLSKETDRIIQLSAVKCVIDEGAQFHEIGRLNTYINPERKLEPKIVKLTGITDEKLSHYTNEDTQWPVILDFFGSSPVLCGHNIITFDIPMMSAAYKRHDAPFLPTALDTLKMAQELHLKEEAGSHKLSDLTTHFGLDYGLAFHNAMDDVTATTRLLRFFVEEYMEKKAIGDPDAPEKIQTKVTSCWTWTSDWNDPKGGGKMQRLYVRVKHENRVVWMNQKRPYNWGEKDKGSIDMFDMQEIENQTLKLCDCSSLDELSKFRGSRTSYAKKQNN